MIDGQNKAVELANVLLFAQSDTLKLLQGTVSDSVGSFELPLPRSGDFLLKFQLIGFQTRTLLIAKSSGQILELGTIALVTDSKLLNTIEVVAQKEFIRRTPQGLIVNADATLTQQGGTAVDLLRNTPTVFVDAEGNVSLRGKSPLILLNGRNSKLTNLANIPASSIESIEIINQPSAEYDAEAENGIINVKLKKGTMNGTNGAFAVGAGYGARRRLNSSLLLNHKVGKWNFGLAYDNRFAKRIRQANGDRTNFNLPTQYFLTQRRNDDRNEVTHNLRANMDFENEKQVLALELIGGIEDEENFETLFSTFETQNRVFISKNRRFSEELSAGKVGELALNYGRKFADKDRKLTLSITSSFNYGTEQTNIDTQRLGPENENTGAPFLQRTSYIDNSNITNVRLDYAQPIGRGKFETGYKTILRFSTNDFSQANQINGQFQVLSALTGILDFREQVHAVYGLYKSSAGNREKPTLEYDFGLRAEQTSNSGAVESQDLRFTNQYLNLFPTAGMTYHFSEDQNLRFSYGRRINRPGLGQLNPFTDITDSLTQRSGNPRLQPELVHTMELGYVQDFRKVSIVGKLFYRNGTNTILPFTVLRPNGVLFTKPENVGSSQTYGIETIFTYNPGPFWNGNFSVSLFEQKIEAGNIQTEAVNQVLSWNAKWINDLTCWKGAKLQVIGVYNAPTATIQGTRIAVYNVDLAFQQKIWQEKGRLGLIVTDVFNTQQNGFVWNTSSFDFSRVVKVDTRAVLLTFAYTFGSKFKDKLMENQFSND